MSRVKKQVRRRRALKALVVGSAMGICLVACSSEAPNLKRTAQSATTTTVTSEVSDMGYDRQIDILSCEEIATINSDLVKGMRLLPPPPPYPGAEDEVPSCAWESPDQGSSLLVGIDRFVVTPDQMRQLQASESPWYQGNYPSYESLRTQRLDAIGAVAVLPDTGRSVFVHLPTVRIEAIADSREVAVEASTRIAEHIVNNHIEDAAPR